MFDLSLTGLYGPFLEVAFALNLISTWEGLYRSLTTMAQDVEANASSDKLSQELVANLSSRLKTLKLASRTCGLFLCILIFVFLLYGLPNLSCQLLLMLLLWACGGVVPVLSAVLYGMVRYYYPFRIRGAAQAERGRREAAKAAERARARLEEELLSRAEEQGRIIRLDKHDDDEDMPF